MTSVTIPPPAPVPVVSQFSSSPPLRSLSPEELLEQTQVLDDLMDNIGMGKFQKQLLVRLFHRRIVVVLFIAIVLCN